MVITEMKSNKINFIQQGGVELNSLQQINVACHPLNYPSMSLLLSLVKLKCRGLNN